MPLATIVPCSSSSNALSTTCCAARDCKDILSYKISHRSFLTGKDWGHFHKGWYALSELPVPSRAHAQCLSICHSHYIMTSTTFFSNSFGNYLRQVVLTAPNAHIRSLYLYTKNVYQCTIFYAPCTWTFWRISLNTIIWHINLAITYSVPSLQLTETPNACIRSVYLYYQYA